MCERRDPAACQRHRRVAKSLALRETQCQLSRSDQEKITSQEAKPDENKSTTSARNMSRSMQGKPGRGRVVRVEHSSRDAKQVAIE